MESTNFIICCLSPLCSTVKTCWMKLAPFNDIGNTLKDRFDGASRVRIGNDFRDYKELRKSAYRKIPVEPYESGKNFLNFDLRTLNSFSILVSLLLYYFPFCDRFVIEFQTHSYFFCGFSL